MRFKSEKDAHEHVKNTENRREQVTPRSLALIPAAAARYKLRVCHRRRRKKTEGIGDSFFFFFFPFLVQSPPPRSTFPRVARVAALGTLSFGLEMFSSPAATFAS